MHPENNESSDTYRIVRQWEIRVAQRAAGDGCDTPADEFTQVDYSRVRRRFTSLGGDFCCGCR